MGNFTIWAGGENLCAHIEQGEEIQAAHVGASAAESLRVTQLPPVSLKEIDDFDWRDTGSEWRGRHSVRAAREGGLFLDIYLRRYRDRLEISTGGEPLQRANAFAAAFLMPTWLLRDELASASAPADLPRTIRAVSEKLRVSISSLVDRLYNLGEITFDERLSLRPVWPQAPER